MSNDNNKLCPSYRPKAGGLVYGVVNESGFINYLNDTIEISESFSEQIHANPSIENKFRFAGNCAKNGCNQWENSHKKCGLVDTIINIVDNSEASELQFCPIRDKCRWFAQRQKLACAQCNEVIRNIEMKIIET